MVEGRLDGGEKGEIEVDDARRLAMETADRVERAASPKPACLTGQSFEPRRQQQRQRRSQQTGGRGDAEEDGTQSMKKKKKKSSLTFAPRRFAPLRISVQSNPTKVLPMIAHHQPGLQLQLSLMTLSTPGDERDHLRWGPTAVL